jgi:hypothetical protein
VPCDSQDLALTGNNQDLIPTDNRQDLILRSARRARLEGWAQARAHCPRASRSPQAEEELRFGWALAHTELFAERCRSSTRIASGTPHNFPDAYSKPVSRLSPHAMTRPPRSAQRVDQRLFALRRGAAKAGHAGRDTTACIAVGDASIAVTSAHVSLIKHADPPRATALT